MAKKIQHLCHIKLHDISCHDNDIHNIAQLHIRMISILTHFVIENGYFPKCKTFKKLTIILKIWSSYREPAEQPDGFGRGGRLSWGGPGGKQPHWAGLNLLQDKDNKHTHKKETTLPPSFTFTMRVDWGAGVSRGVLFAETPSPLIETKTSARIRQPKHLSQHCWNWLRQTANSSVFE